MGFFSIIATNEISTCEFCRSSDACQPDTDTGAHHRMHLIVLQQLCRSRRNFLSFWFAVYYVLCCSNLLDSSQHRIYTNTLAQIITYKERSGGMAQPMCPERKRHTKNLIFDNVWEGYVRASHGSGPTFQPKKLPHRI